MKLLKIYKNITTDLTKIEKIRDINNSEHKFD